MINTFSLYFLLFIVYSFLGWCMEVIVCLIKEKKLINRGFFLGPYCPIYGCAAISMAFLLKQYAKDLIVLFILSATLCTTIEYVTSVLMEKLFNARWWDYTDKKFNVNGRVCLVNSFYFGVLGCLTVRFIGPFLISLFSALPTFMIYIVSSCLLVIFVIDNIISFNVISKIKHTTDLILKDSTEEITEKIKEAFGQQSVLSKRLFKAYPDFKNALLKKKDDLKNFVNSTEEDLKNAIVKKNAELKELQENLQFFLDNQQEKLKNKLTKENKNKKD